MRNKFLILCISISACLFAQKTKDFDKLLSLFKEVPFPFSKDLTQYAYPKDTIDTEFINNVIWKQVMGDPHRPTLKFNNKLYPFKAIGIFSSGSFGIQSGDKLYSYQITIYPVLKFTYKGNYGLVVKYFTCETDSYDLYLFNANGYFTSVIPLYSISYPGFCMHKDDTIMEYSSHFNLDSTFIVKRQYNEDNGLRYVNTTFTISDDGYLEQIHSYSVYDQLFMKNELMSNIYEAEINDPDGYTNVRYEPNINSEIAYEILKNQVFIITDKVSVDEQDRLKDWYYVLRYEKEGKIYSDGYIHKSRVKIIKKRDVGKNLLKIKLI